MKFAYSLLKEYLPDLTVVQAGVQTDLNPKQMSDLLTHHGIKVESLETIGNDAIMELEITANRPDCLSLIGVAREVLLLNKSQSKIGKCVCAGNKKFSDEELSPKNKQSFITILNQEVCPIYIGRIIRDVKVAPSPDWLRQHVESFGMRSINNVVDITNLVLMETGQPLHAFDLDKLKDQQIIVRNAAQGEQIIAIDEKTYELTEEDLVIADAGFTPHIDYVRGKPVAIAGVMGGKLTEVSWSTKNILLESAYFQAGNVRKTSRKLKLSSDSSYRFERGIDPKSVDINSQRATELILQIAGGKVSDYQALDYFKFQEKKLTLRFERVKRILGIDIPATEIKRIVTALGLTIADEQTSGQINVIAPSFRTDIQLEIDIIEELARVWGYDKIPVTAPRIELKVSAEDKIDDTIQSSRSFLVESGYSEALTNSFWDPPAAAEGADRPQIPADQIAIIAPDGNIDRILRTSLAKGMTETFNTQDNYLRTETKKIIRLFEISKIYYKSTSPCHCENPAQAGDEAIYSSEIAARPHKNGVARNDKNSQATIQEKFHLALLDNGSFYALKGTITNLLSFLGITNLIFKQADKNISAYPMPLNGLENITALSIDGKYLGYLGVLTVNQPQDVLKTNQPVQKIAIAELDFEAIIKSANLTKKYQAFSRFPEVKRDIAVLVPEPTKWSEIETTTRKAILSSGKDVPLEKIEFFDLYRGKQIPEGQKSVAFSLSFRHPSKTLASADVDEVMKATVDALGKSLQAVLRA